MGGGAQKRSGIVWFEIPDRGAGEINHRATGSIAIGDGKWAGVIGANREHVQVWIAGR